jgi:hypothetical protein
MKGESRPRGRDSLFFTADNVGMSELTPTALTEVEALLRKRFDKGDR